MPVFFKNHVFCDLSHIKPAFGGGLPEASAVAEGASGADEREPLGLLAFDRSVAVGDPVPLTLA